MALGVIHCSCVRSLPASRSRTPRPPAVCASSRCAGMSVIVMHCSWVTSPSFAGPRKPAPGESKIIRPPLSSSSSPCRTVPSLYRSRTRSVKPNTLTSQSIAAPASSLTAEEMGLVTSAPCPGRPSRVSGLPLPLRFGSYRGHPKEPCARTEHAASAEAIPVPVVCPPKNPAGATTGAPARPMRDPRIEAHGYDMQAAKNPGGYDQAHSVSVRPGYEQGDALHYPKACSAQGPPEPAPGPDFLGQSQYSCRPYEIGDPQ
jgi:hypothetical protein